jgi:hypothetical protein
MGVASPMFTRKIEPSVDALVSQVRSQAAPAAPKLTLPPDTARNPAAGRAVEESRR